MSDGATMAADADALVVARQTIALHSKSFALASRVLPAESRDAAAVVYTWCRRADDAVDLAGPGEAMPALDRLRRELDDVYAGQPRDPVLQAFAAIARQRNLPRHYPAELLAGMEMDVVGARYETFEDLVTYGYRVAGVVGLMMCHVMGVADDRALQHATHLGIGMQITNICRDVVEDWERGRLYLPADMLARHGARDLAAHLGGPLPVSAAPALAATVGDLLAVAERYYRSGDRGLHHLPWRCAFAVRAARHIYSAIGVRLARRGHDVTAGRAVVPTWRKLSLVGSAAAWAGVQAPLRLARRLAGRPRPRVPMTVLELTDVARC
jgi:phytoene synthase